MWFPRIKNPVYKSLVDRVWWIYDSFFESLLIFSLLSSLHIFLFVRSIVVFIQMSLHASCGWCKEHWKRTTLCAVLLWFWETAHSTYVRMLLRLVIFSSTNWRGPLRFICSFLLPQKTSFQHFNFSCFFFCLNESIVILRSNFLGKSFLNSVKSKSSNPFTGVWIRNHWLWCDI